MTLVSVSHAQTVDEQNDWSALAGEAFASERPLPLRPDASDLAAFRTRRELGRRYLPFLKTLTDFDITSEVGFHELTGPPLTVKQLILLDLAPSMTVFRRLDRLCNLGVVSRTRSMSDGRVNELRLTPAVHRLFAAFASESAASLRRLT
jgi:hypothetical protein